MTATDHEAVRQAMERVGVLSMTDRELDGLSDGEHQRVMVAKALAQGAPVLLLDEPTAFLDLPGRLQLLRLLRNVAREEGRAVLFSTHDLAPALQVCDRLLLVREAGMLWQGTSSEAMEQGVLAATFNGPGVIFDPTLGSFRLEA
jgi:iron complex transport system ATP-binding protein